jgi:subtilisin family serine protease
MVELVGPLADATASLDSLVERFGARITDEEVLAAPGAPTELVYPDPGPLRRIAAPWDPLASVRRLGSALSGNSRAIVVAIVDSGVMTEHPALRDRLEPGISVIGPDVEDEDGHGTLLAGTILSTTNYTPAVRLMPVQFIDGRTRPRSDRAAEAIEETMRQEPYPDIVNLSWDLGVESPALRKALAVAAARKVLVVVAAGNSGADNDAYPTFPACYGHDMCQAVTEPALPNVITVMATDRDDYRPGFSNYGATSVHLAAPGVGIVSAHQYLGAAPTPGRGSKYQRYDGTSAAAAYVSGAAALLKSINRSLDSESLKKLLMNTVDTRPDRPPLPCQAGGRLSLGRALVAASPGDRPA